MICNAGIALPKPIHETTPEEWDRVMGVNVKAIYWAARHVVPVMRKQGGGLFLLTGSISSVCGMDLQGVYGPSKGAVIQITRTMAVDYAQDNIRVNAVCPGVVETPLLRRTADRVGRSGQVPRRPRRRLPDRTERPARGDRPLLPVPRLGSRPVLHRLRAHDRRRLRGPLSLEAKVSRCSQLAPKPVRTCGLAATLASTTGSGTYDRAGLPSLCVLWRWRRSPRPSPCQG